MISTYVIFGLKVQSNEPLPGLRPREDISSAPDILLELGRSPENTRIASARESLWYESLDLSGKPALQIWQLSDCNFLRVDYFDGMKFWLDRSGNSVWAVWPENSSLEIAVSYLLGPVLGLVLRLRGVTCLHASAINLRGCAVAFVGPPGAGKSTTAAAMAARGHAVISDDIVALSEENGAFGVLPAYPHLCLWPDSVAMLFGSPDALPRLSSDSEKRRMALGSQLGPFQETKVRLSVIYMVGERRSNAAALFASISPQEALISLVSNTYAANIPLEPLRASEFSLLGRLLSLVPVRRLHPHSDPNSLSHLCEAIEQERVGRSAPSL